MATPSPMAPRPMTPTVGTGADGARSVGCSFGTGRPPVGRGVVWCVGLGDDGTTPPPTGSPHPTRVGHRRDRSHPGRPVPCTWTAVQTIVQFHDPHQCATARPRAPDDRGHRAPGARRLGLRGHPPAALARQAEVVAQLVRAAEEEIEEVGYAGLTVRSVARRAGVAPATAYTYFSSKDHLLAEVLWRRMQSLHRSSRRQPARARSGWATPCGTWCCSPPRAPPWSTPAPWPCSAPAPTSSTCGTGSGARSTAGWRPPSGRGSTPGWSGCSRPPTPGRCWPPASGTCPRWTSPSSWPRRPTLMVDGAPRGASDR